MSDYSAAWCEENPGAASLTIERLRARLSLAERSITEFKADRSEVIEECARVVEQYARALNLQGMTDNIAGAIRALKDKP